MPLLQISFLIKYNFLGGFNDWQNSDHNDIFSACAACQTCTSPAHCLGDRDPTKICLRLILPTWKHICSANIFFTYLSGCWPLENMLANLKTLLLSLIKVSTLLLTYIFKWSINSTIRCSIPHPTRIPSNPFIQPIPSTVLHPSVDGLLYCCWIV